MQLQIFAINYGKRKEDWEDSQYFSNYRPEQPEKVDKDNPKKDYKFNQESWAKDGTFKFDPEFLKSPFWSASVGLEKIGATNIPMENHPGIKKAYHATTNKVAGLSIIEKIDAFMENPNTRFGGGFYVASDKQTSFAELESHEKDQFNDPNNKDPQLLLANEIIEFDVSGGDLVDCTRGELAILVENQPQQIEARVRQDRRDGIVFKSTKGPGLNMILYNNQESILKPTSKTPQPARKDYDKFKMDKKTDEMQKNGGLSKIKDASRTNVGTI